VPAVDLVVVIDTSASMRDEAADLSRAVDAAIEAARSLCPSDLRVTCLGIEGTFRATRFDKTVRNYLTKEAGADPSDGDDRAYLLDNEGRVWIVTDTRAAQWQAQYRTQFGRPVGKLPASYFGIAFDAQETVYLCGGVDDGTADYRFLATSSFDKPDQVNIIYRGEPGSSAYGNLSSRAYPKVRVPLD
jgi:hypothetical protein